MDLVGKLLGGDVKTSGAVKGAQEKKVAAVNDSDGDGIRIDFHHHGGAIGVYEAERGESGGDDDAGSIAAIAECGLVFMDDVARRKCGDHLQQAVTGADVIRKRGVL